MNERKNKHKKKSWTELKKSDKRGEVYNITKGERKREKGGNKRAREERRKKEGEEIDRDIKV